ncbi:MAG: hypothetical protein KBT11_03595 [Treponema sp.]|nr:hypothetical protein [Candidatus Treponema equifaecale]
MKPVKTEEKKASGNFRKNAPRRQKAVSIRRELFDEKAVPAESQKILQNFDDIVADVRGLSGKQKVGLYGAIKNLSHQLTDERGNRRIGYMNDAGFISAYISYFMWWNLVRLTRLFSNLPKSAFELEDGSVALDIGSGPLTVPIALWLARPELRSKKITWYCMDLSQTALSAGEDLYLSIAAKTIAAGKESSEANQNNEDLQNENSINTWRIIRVKGPLGTSIKEKADLVTCGNVFNEIVQRNEMPTDFLAKKYSGDLISYMEKETEKKQTLLLIEPGDPHSARFVSLMRDAFIRRDFIPVAPCTHTAECPMAGRTHGKAVNSYGKNAKWCNFAFNTDSAPAKLLKLSEKAGLPKERAGLSFILAQKAAVSKENPASKQTSGKTKQNPEAEKTFIRIASDFIRLPDLHKSGYYACSQFGMLLAIDESHVQPKNGELLQIKTPENLSERDKKSGALIVKI